MPDFQQRVPREADDEDRGVLHRLVQVLDQVEERRLRPVDVLEDEDDRALAGKGLEEPSRPPHELAHRELRIREPHGGGDSVGDLAVASCRLGDFSTRDLGRILIGDRRGLADRLSEWPEGDAAAVGKAAAAKDECRAGHGGRELADQARLADPGLAEDRDQPASTLGDGLVERRSEEALLALAAHQRQVGTASGRVAFGHVEEAVGGNRLGLALQLDRGRERLGVDVVLDEPIRQLPEQRLHLSRPIARDARRR